MRRVGFYSRGLFPAWANKDTTNLPEPKWPGQMDDKYFDRSKLEEFYKPWIELVNKGIGVHCGEGGCWKRTPHVFIYFARPAFIVVSNHFIIMPRFTHCNVDIVMAQLCTGNCAIQYRQYAYCCE